MVWVRMKVPQIGGGGGQNMGLLGQRVFAVVVAGELGGGNSNIVSFHPENWGNDSI